MGTVAAWAEGDGISPGEGELQGLSSLGDLDLQLGTGKVAANGSFTFNLEEGARAAKGGVPVAELFCAEVTASDPALRVADVQGIMVPQLLVEGEHGRPMSTISILQGKLLEPQAAFVFYYASADAQVTGACDNEYLGRVHYALELKQGWNSAKLDYATGTFTTEPLTSKVRWHLSNPLTWSLGR